MATQRESVGLNKGVRMKGKNSLGGSIVDPPKDLPTLAEAGIDKRLADEIFPTSVKFNSTADVDDVGEPYRLYTVVTVPR